MEEILEEVLTAVEDKKARTISLLEVKELSSVADYFLICSGNTRTQTKAIADGIFTRVKEKTGITPIGIEGQDAGNWILLDYNFLIVHIFTPEEKDYYDLERIWGDAKKIDLEHVGE